MGACGCDGIAALAISADRHLARRSGHGGLGALGLGRRAVLPDSGDVSAVDIGGKRLHGKRLAKGQRLLPTGESPAGLQMIGADGRTIVGRSHVGISFVGADVEQLILDNGDFHCVNFHQRGKAAGGPIEISQPITGPHAGDILQVGGRQSVGAIV